MGEELKEVLGGKSEGGGKGQDAAIEAILLEVDKSGDGCIDFDEFMDMMAAVGNGTMGSAAMASMHPVEEKAKDAKDPKDAPPQAPSKAIAKAPAGAPVKEDKAIAKAAPAP